MAKIISIRLFQGRTGKLNTIANIATLLAADLQKHLITGVAYMIPFVTVGGILMAISFMWGIEAFKVEGTISYYLMKIGSTAFSLMIPILAGYISYSIADNPGIAPGVIAGMLATSLQPSAGFLGGLISGLLAGYTTNFVKKIKLPRAISGLMPVLVIPLIATLAVGVLMLTLIGPPCAAIQSRMTNWLKNISGISSILLGGAIGAMMAFDLGGPVNKVAYMFGLAMISEGYLEPQAAVMTSGMVPALAMGLATLLAPRKYTLQEREAGKTAWVAGASFISEGAIPFAAADPLKVIPSLMIGGAVTGSLSMGFHLTLAAPHGGLFVLPLNKERNRYCIHYPESKSSIARSLKG